VIFSSTTRGRKEVAPLRILKDKGEEGGRGGGNEEEEESGRIDMLIIIRTNQYKHTPAQKKMKKISSSGIKEN